MLYVLYVKKVYGDYEHDELFKMFLTEDDARAALQKERVISKDYITDFGIFRIAEVILTNMTFKTESYKALSELCDNPLR